METEHGDTDSTVHRDSVPVSNNHEELGTSSISASFHMPWKFVRSCANTMVYTLIGGSSFVTLWFGMKSPSEMTIFQWHIVLCVTGYQLLMPYAMICLQSDSWASALSFTHRRRAHWIMQLVGSILAFVGSVLMMSRKTVNFNTLHGRFALAALLFTVVSLANGLFSLYASQLRRYMPPRLAILSHTLIGTLAFLLSSVCLVYGYLKHSFTDWASREFAYVLIIITCSYTFLICFSPICKICRKLFEVVKDKMF
ncbi:uncharacterized protein LOC125235586 [Leguminivora glycinivorella]|uniref:uncharacterized protein LOC125235586 n=1 Tax=Leguminivora glycinivorella TaxID=1035111 RepID=UPI00200F2B13|nr:uncharacterized protein LOC125235586 [Leguminivora glycinivorella]